MFARDVARDGEAKPTPAADRPRPPLARIENSGAIPERNSRALIADLNGDQIIEASGSYKNGSTDRRVPDRVLHEVLNRRAKPRLVPVDNKALLSEQRNVPIKTPCVRPVRLADITSKRPDIDHAGVHVRTQDQAVQRNAHPLDLSFDQSERPHHGRVAPAPKGEALPADHSQRAPHVVYRAVQLTHRWRAGGSLRR